MLMAGYLASPTIGFLSAGTALFSLLYFLRKWCDGGVCRSKARLDGRTVVITGADNGIGKETALDLAKRGAVVVMACRDKSRGDSAVKDVKEKSGSNKVFLKILDLASLYSIREFAKSFVAEYKELDILINNADVRMCPHTRTKDGFEMHLGVNHLGHFALTNLLLPCMVETTPGRIINVASRLHACEYISKVGINFEDINSEKNYDAVVAYCRSKLANVLFTKELNKKLENTGVTTYALHPGIINNELYSIQFKILRYLLAPFIFKSPTQGAQTVIYCAVQEGIEDSSGLYFSDCAVKESSKISYDEGMAKKLWELSEEMTGIKFPLYMYAVYRAQMTLMALRLYIPIRLK